MFLLSAIQFAEPSSLLATFNLFALFFTPYGSFR